MHTETKAMIITAIILMITGVYKWLAVVSLITAVIYEEGVKKIGK